MNFQKPSLERILNIIKISLVINTELKYQFLKNTKRFQTENKYDLYQAKRYLANSVYYSIIANIFIYGILSLIFGETAYRNIGDMKNLLLSIFGLILILGIMSDSQFFRGIWDMNLIAPLRTLPIKVNTEVVPLATFLFNESFLFAVSLPAAVFLAYGFHNPLIFISIFLYTVFFIYVARTISLLLGIMWSKYNTNRITKRLYLSQIMQLLFVLVFIFSIQIVTNPNLLQDIKFPSQIFAFFPLSPQILLRNTYVTITTFIVEFIPIYGLYTFLIRRSFSEKFETYIEISRNKVENKKANRPLKSRNQISALILKDFKSLARKRGALIIIILPAIFMFPLIYNLSYSGVESQLLPYVIPYFSTVFLISFIELVALEGKGAWHLSYLPITRKSFFMSKFVEIISIASVYYFILYLLASTIKFSGIDSFITNFPFYIVLITTLIFAGGGYIIKTIPEGVTVISMDALGGRAFFLKVMLISLPLVILNAFIFGESQKFISIFSAGIIDSYFSTLLLDSIIIITTYYMFIRKTKSF